MDLICIWLVVQVLLLDLEFCDQVGRCNWNHTRSFIVVRSNPMLKSLCNAFCLKLWKWAKLGVLWKMVWTASWIEFALVKGVLDVLDLPDILFSGMHLWLYHLDCKAPWWALHCCFQGAWCNTLQPCAKVREKDATWGPEHVANWHHKAIFEEGTLARVHDRKTVLIVFIIVNGLCNDEAPWREQRTIEGFHPRSSPTLVTVMENSSPMGIPMVPKHIFRKCIKCWTLIVVQWKAQALLWGCVPIRCVDHSVADATDWLDCFPMTSTTSEKCAVDAEQEVGTNSCVDEWMQSQGLMRFSVEDLLWHERVTILVPEGLCVPGLSPFHCLFKDCALKVMRWLLASPKLKPYSNTAMTTNSLFGLWIPLSRRQPIQLWLWCCEYNWKWWIGCSNWRVDSDPWWINWWSRWWV